jgi:phospholipase/carboxylesterase
VPWIAPKEQLAGLPILLVHGTHDTVIGVEHARKAHAILQDLPVALDYHEFDMAHEVTPQVLRLALAWLTARLAEPRREQEQ